MKSEWIETPLLLLLLCVSVALCQDTDSSEAEAVTENVFFNRVVDYVSNATDSLSSEEGAEHLRQVFGVSSRNWFQNLTPEDEYIAACGGMSTSAQTVWQNSEYPEMEHLPGFCTLNLLPPAGTCALKIHFDDLNLQIAEPDFFSCGASNPFFKATTPDRITAVYCQKLDGFEGILHISDTTEPTILLLQLDPNEKFKFKVSISAVNCNDIKTYESPSDCGIKNQDLKTMRAELFGLPEIEEAQGHVAADYKQHMPLAYRQRRRVYKNESQSQDKKDKNKNNPKRYNGKKKDTGSTTTTTTTTIKRIMHPILEKFKEGIAAAAEAGKISKPNGDRVVGKQTTLVNEWPWIVYIERNVAQFDIVISCNGLLLDNSKVLTSRDCVMFTDQQPYGVSDLSVRVGDHDLNSNTETTSKTVGVSKVSVALQNELFDLNNAFAILHLKEEVQLDDKIRPICFPASYNKFPDKSGVIAGWDFSFGQPISPIPNSAKVQVLEQADCQEVLVDFYGYSMQEAESADVTCAADKFGVGVVCFNEQGSALTQRDQRGAYYVTGVAGGRNECFFRGVPTVFSNIQHDNHLLNAALG